MSDQTTASNDNLFNFEVTKKALQDLISIIEEETSLLKNNKPEELQKNHKKKLDLINFIEIQNGTLRNKKSVQDSLSQDEKNTLKELAQKLHTSSSVNKDELAKAKYFNEELMKLVVEAVKNESIPVKVYNDRGAKKSADSQKVFTPALSFNENI